MNRLEERYRAVLRVLPAEYRRVWEDDMVSAYLESVDTDDPEEAAYLADYGRPSFPEVASVLGLAVRLRLGLAGSPAPRAAAWGDAVRLAALIGVLFNAVLAIAATALHLWLTHRVPVLPPPTAEWLAADASPWLLVVQLCDLGWIAAFAMLMRGRWRSARLLALVGLTPNVAVALADAVTPWLALALIAGTVLGFRLLTLLEYVVFTAPQDRAAWLTAGAVEAVAVLGVGAPLAVFAAGALHRLHTSGGDPT